MKAIEKINYTNAKLPEQFLDLFLPDCETFPVYIYFHGGGLTRKSPIVERTEPRELKGFAEYLVKNGVAVIMAEYRCYPDACYPEYIVDAASVVAWAKNHMSEYGNVTGLFVGGASAGGYLTQMLCFDKKYLGKHGIDPDSITGYIMDAGQPTTHFNVLKERGIDSRRVIVDEAAPLYHVCAGRDYPPMQIIVAENDMKNRYEQTQLLISTLKHFGYDESKIDYRFMPGFKHCEYGKHFDEDGNNILGKVYYDFISKHV
jgi:acetyl esterase/lipase